MAGAGVIQAELAISIGQSLAALNQAQAAIAKFAQGVGPGMKPANDAVDGLGKTIQRFKSEQVGQARTVNFFVKELTEITGLSREAAGAVGGLGQVMLEAASGGGAFAIGFEAVKLVLGQIVTEWRRAGEELKSVERIQQRVTDAMMAGKEALEKYSGAIKTAGDKAFADVLSAATESIKGVSKELDDLRAKGPGVLAYIRLAFKDTDMIDAFEERVRKASLAIEQIINRASNQADIARALAQEGQRAAQAAAANRVLADDYTKARERAAKAAAQEAREQARISALIGSTMDRMGDSASADRGNFPDMFYSQATADSLKAAEDGRNAPVFGPGNDIGAADFAMKAKEIDALNKSASATRDIFAQLGDGISSAFSSIGSAIGGAAGEFISQVGAMITQTIALVLALAFSDTLMTGPLGLFAAVPMAAGILASLIAMIASAPSYEVGTPYVPRTGMAMLHQGERVIPASQNAAGFGGSSITVNISATDAGSFEKMLRRNDNALVRVLRDSQRAGRG